MRAEHLDPPTPARMLQLHRQIYAHTMATGGRLKQEDNVISERDLQGVRTVIFKPPPWQQTEGLIQGLFAGYQDAVESMGGRHGR
jgi:Fic family protein